MAKAIQPAVRYCILQKIRYLLAANAVTLNDIIRALQSVVGKPEHVYW